VARPSVDGKDTSLYDGDGVDGRGVQAIHGVEGVSCGSENVTLLVGDMAIASGEEVVSERVQGLKSSVQWQSSFIYELLEHD
jgi:hypothetical protein